LTICEFLCDQGGDHEEIRILKRATAKSQKRRFSKSCGRKTLSKRRFSSPKEIEKVKESFSLSQERV
jgi:hypothetical protein